MLPDLISFGGITAVVELLGGEALVHLADIFTSLLLSSSDEVFVFVDGVGHLGLFVAARVVAHLAGQVLKRHIFVIFERLAELGQRSSRQRGHAVVRHLKGEELQVRVADRAFAQLGNQVDEFKLKVRGDTVRGDFKHGHTGLVPLVGRHTRSDKEVVEVELGVRVVQAENIVARVVP